MWVELVRAKTQRGQHMSALSRYERRGRETNIHARCVDISEEADAARLGGP